MAHLSLTSIHHCIPNTCHIHLPFSLQWHVLLCHDSWYSSLNLPHPQPTLATDATYNECMYLKQWDVWTFHIYNIFGMLKQRTNSVLCYDIAVPISLFQKNCVNPNHLWCLCQEISKKFVVVLVLSSRKKLVTGNIMIFKKMLWHISNANDEENYFSY